MLQRVQSLFLILVVALSVLYIVLPLGTFKMNDASVDIVLAVGSPAPESVASEHAVWYRSVLSALPLLALVYTIFIIFQYRRRMYQVKLGKVNILIHLIILVISFFYLDSLRQALPHMSFSFGPAVFFPIVSLILILRANRLIIKDEKLVRAADRIR